MEPQSWRPDIPQLLRIPLKSQGTNPLRVYREYRAYLGVHWGQLELEHQRSLSRTPHAPMKIIIPRAVLDVTPKRPVVIQHLLPPSTDESQTRPVATEDAVDLGIMEKYVEKQLCGQHRSWGLQFNLEREQLLQTSLLRRRRGCVAQGRDFRDNCGQINLTL